jgi:charged multivesicular body protein 6
MGAFCSAQINKTSTLQRPIDPKLSTSATISATDRAILDLKNARDRLTKYKTNLEQDEKKLLIRAKEIHAQGQKNMARQLLKLRHFKLNEVDQVEKQLLNVLQLVETIHSTQNEHEVLRAMKTGKDALERMHQEITVDQVLELMEDIKEQHQIESEISTLIGGAFTALDDSEIEADMAALEKELQEEAKIQQQHQEMELEEENLQLPDVPTTKLPDIRHIATSSPAVEEQRILAA